MWRKKQGEQQQQPKKVKEEESDRRKRSRKGGKGEEAEVDVEDDPIVSTQITKSEKETKKDLSKEKTAKLLKTLVKAVLAATQQLRDVNGILLLTLLVPSGSEMVKSMKAQTKMYSEEPRDDRTALGPPHVFACLGLLGALVEADTANTASKGLIKSHLDEVADLSADTVAKSVKYCKASKCYDPEKVKLSLFFIMNEQLQEAITTAIENNGGHRKTGSAPKGHLERELAEWLEQLG